MVKNERFLCFNSVIKQIEYILSSFCLSSLTFVSCS